jgi:hypothetical protein
MRSGGKTNLTMLEQHAMLAVAALQPNAYTSAISEHIGRHTGQAPLRTSLWVALPGLARRGLVRSKQGKPSPVQGGRSKFYWSITPEGRMVLTESLKNVGRLIHSAGLQKTLA